MKSSTSAARAEKRVLWEVRQRYQVGSNTGTITPPGGSAPPPVSRPPSPPLSNLPPRRPARSSKRSRGWGPRAATLLILILILSGGVFGYKILAASNKITTSDRSVLGQLKDLLFTQGKTLAGEPDERINILLLAIGGQGHTGQNLADTVMVVSIRPSDHAVGILSIPRDLYVQVPDEQYFTKINAVHAYGEAKKKGEGPVLLKKKVEEITGQPIHYYGRIDFTAFKQIVDAVGGVNVTIDNSFFDYWHKISFSAGQESMNGERALAYVRARYIEGPEGGDFKRAARQQQVLLALRDKIFSVNTAFDFTAVNSILNSLSDNIRTDMELWELKRFYEIARQVDENKVNSVVLTTGPRGILVGSTEVLSGVPASILKPRTGDFTEIQAVMSDIFRSTPTSVPTSEGDTVEPTPEAEPTPTPETEEAAEKVSVEVRNGTTITGLAKATAEKLESEGYTITSIGNAAVRNHEHTTVYAQATADAASAKSIAQLLEAAADVDLPDGEAKSSAAVVVILGTDAKSD